MKRSASQKGFTVIELTVLIFIAALVLAIAIPKFIMASHMRKTKRVAVVLNRLWDAEYEYHKKYGRFADDVERLDIRKSDLKSKWFDYTVSYATHDTFFVMARVREPFGLATTDDYLGISSAKIRQISNRATLGKYAVEWMILMRKDEKRRQREARRKAAGKG